MGILGILDTEWFILKIEGILVFRVPCMKSDRKFSEGEGYKNMI